jgi:hypothetical protein
VAGSYAWLKLSDAITQLGQRLNITPSTSSFWTAAELQAYIVTALRIFNSLTYTWRTDFNFQSTQVWNSLGFLPKSPRLRTLTDTDAYTELEYMLMEPPSGSVWSGTNQFQITDLSQALQRRRDEILQITNCNQQLMPNIPLTPNEIRTELPDNVIDVARVRYIPGGQLSGGYGTGGYGEGGYGTGGFTNGPSPITLYRDDTVAQEFYEAPLYQQNSGDPQTFSLSSEPPLSWQVDIPPSQDGVYEAVVLQSGAPFNPPAATLLGIPNDFSYVLENGALADLLGKESESTDRERAAYCQKRYQDGLQLMLKTPWIELGRVNGQAVSIDSIVAADRYSPEWDSNPTGFGPMIVAGGMDFVAAPVNSNVGLTVLGNAPVPSLPSDYLQVSRSDWEIVILLAQSRSLFKMGGGEWKAGLELEKEAILACANENSRLRSLGCFSDILVQRGAQQERDMNRFNTANADKGKI